MNYFPLNPAMTYGSMARVSGYFSGGSRLVITAPRFQKLLRIACVTPTYQENEHFLNA